MDRKTQSNQSVKKILLYFYMVLILFALITVASYTWFAISRTPSVSDMNLYVNSSTRLELSQDPLAEKWTLQLDLQDLMPASTPLRPITWVNEAQCFYAPTYDLRGNPQAFSQWQPLTDERHANKDTLDGYYIKLTFYARATSSVKVTLSPAVEVDEGIYGSGTFVIGTPVWNDENICHDNAGYGAEMAVRIGIRLTPVDSTGQPTGEESSFFIYEPNSDGHADGTQGYVPTPGITGAESLIDAPFLIRQTMSGWTETDPVEQDVVIKNLGEFQDTPVLCFLAAGEMVRMDIYIWLEGQDADCIELIQDAQIMACLQFDADPTGGSGIQPIE